MHKQHKKSFFETDEFHYRVAFRNDIMARQDFQKVCRSLCAFQPYSQQESFCGKKSFFFSFTCALILDANLDSIQPLKNVL